MKYVVNDKSHEKQMSVINFSSFLYEALLFEMFVRSGSQTEKRTKLTVYLCSEFPPVQNLQLTQNKIITGISNQHQHQQSAKAKRAASVFVNVREYVPLIELLH